MSQERIERVEAALATYNEGRLDGLLDLFTDDIALQRVAGLGTLHGKAEVHALLVPDAFEYQRVHPTRMLESGDAVFVACDFVAKGRGSGAELVTTAYLVVFFQADLVNRIELHLDEPDALAAAGLEAA